MYGIRLSGRELHVSPRPQKKTLTRPSIVYKFNFHPLQRNFDKIVGVLCKPALKEPGAQGLNKIESIMTEQQNEIEKDKQKVKELKAKLAVLIPALSDVLQKVSLLQPSERARKPSVVLF